MTDGIHSLSKMVGDVKFHQHRAIDARDAGLLPAGPAGMDEARRLLQVYAAHAAAVRRYRPGPYPGPLLVVAALRQRRRRRLGPTLGWERFAAGDLDSAGLDADHHGLLREPAVSALAARLDVFLAVSDREEVVA